MGNAESLAEESHEDGLLEYPVYTKPRELARPRRPAGAAAAATTARSRRGGTTRPLRRTAQRRPDLLPPTSLPGGEVIAPAVPADAGELLTLQRACWVQEQQANPGVHIPALHESLDDVRRWLAEWTVLTCAAASRLVGAARARLRRASSGTSAG